MENQKTHYLNATQNRRKELIELMAKWLDNGVVNNDVEQLLVKFCCNYGVSMTKAKEYLELATAWNKMKLVEVGGLVKAEPDVV